MVAHRRELIRQASTKLTDAGVLHGIICADFPVAPDELVQVASVQTLAHRLDDLPMFDLIVLDECHHARAGQWQALIASQPRAKLLGVSATPARLDGQGLGTAAAGCFDDIVSGPPIAELVRDGYLSPCRIFTPDERLDLRGVRTRAGDYVMADLERVMGGAQIIGNTVATYREHADHLPAIAFCVSIAHAEEMAERFRAAGYRSTCAHGGTSTAERDAAIAGLGNGDVEVLTACDLISEGLDVPVVGAVILLRPTKSLVLYMQQIGRGMRPAPGKRHLIVLDHVGNIAAHGLPDLERNWTLDGIETPEPEAPSEPEHQRVAQQRVIRETSGRLTELTANRVAIIRQMPYRVVLGAKLTEAELQIYAAARGYRPGWVWHRLRAQQQMGRPA